MPEYAQPADFVRPALFSGLVIPAHPLAITAERRLDERRMLALARYYLDAGAGGLAVGVHSTQFAIRDPRYGLFEPVLRLASQAISEWEARQPGGMGAAGARRIVRIAGIVGRTEQALREACLARELGYQAGLLSLAALPDASDDELLAHARRVAGEIPLFGFYLQPAVGGRVLSYRFWRSFAEIENVVGIKIAPFNRYQSLDVARSVAESGRAAEVALYTGNDDHIVLDLLCEYVFHVNGSELRVGMQGGLLGHWACWTRPAVELLARCRAARAAGQASAGLLALAGQVTDSNAAFFDAANNYAGVLPGIHEVLRRQGLLANNLCLDPHECLSPGQVEEIERVYRAYPHLNDDDFVRENLDRWLG
jgi:dihydrodipicolinate synthase/N-acetylneuraminate lyase